MPEDAEVGHLGDYNRRSVRKCPNKYAALISVVTVSGFFYWLHYQCTVSNSRLVTIADV